MVQNKSSKKNLIEYIKKFKKFKKLRDICIYILPRIYKEPQYILYNKYTYKQLQNYIKLILFLSLRRDRNSINLIKNKRRFKKLKKTKKRKKFRNIMC